MWFVVCHSFLIHSIYLSVRLSMIDGLDDDDDIDKYDSNAAAGALWRLSSRVRHYHHHAHDYLLILR
jgi:hypothetical protein